MNESHEDWHIALRLIELTTSPATVQRDEKVREAVVRVEDDKLHEIMSFWRLPGTLQVG